MQIHPATGAGIILRRIAAAFKLCTATDASRLSIDLPTMKLTLRKAFFCLPRWNSGRNGWLLTLSTAGTLWTCALANGDELNIEAATNASHSAISLTAVHTPHPLDGLLRTTNWTTIKFEFTTPRKGNSYAELRRSGNTKFILHVEKDPRSLSKWILTSTSQLLCRSNDVYWYFLGEQTSDIFEAQLVADTRGITNTAALGNIRGAANTVTAWSHIASMACNFGLPWFDVETLQLRPPAEFTATGALGQYTIRGRGQASDPTHKLTVDYEQLYTNGNQRQYRAVVDFVGGTTQAPRDILLYSLSGDDPKQVGSIRIRELREDTHPDIIFSAANYFFHGVTSYIRSTPEGIQVRVLDPKNDRVVWLFGRPVRSKTVRIGLIVIVGTLLLILAWSLKNRIPLGLHSNKET